MNLFNKKEDKDKIIEILREEIALTKRMNLKVLNEKDKLIKTLRNIIQAKEEIIKVLKKRLKGESETQPLIL